MLGDKSFVGILSFYFFFQAEDGIRDGHVTGVQTCALPILDLPRAAELPHRRHPGRRPLRPRHARRSEERRVGKSVGLGGCRNIKKKKQESSEEANRPKKSDKQTRTPARAEHERARLAGTTY